MSDENKVLLDRAIKDGCLCVLHMMKARYPSPLEVPSNLLAIYIAINRNVVYEEEDNDE